MQEDKIPWFIGAVVVIIACVAGIARYRSR